jgi:hypothetical protein
MQKGEAEHSRRRPEKLPQSQVNEGCDGIDGNLGSLTAYFGVFPLRLRGEIVRHLCFIGERHLHILPLREMDRRHKGLRRIARIQT